jgi:hypothetical protein
MAYVPPGVLLEAVTISVEALGLAPLMITGYVLKEQLGGGVPPLMLLHERLTLPVYPFAGVTMIVEVAALPAVTVPGLNAAAVSA